MPSPLQSIPAYQHLYQQSMADSTAFWRAQALDRLAWSQPFTVVQQASFTPPVHIKWFEDGALNACYNCVDRHAARTPGRTAIIWESDEGDETLSITYAELQARVQKFANVLKACGVQKGDRVTIYLPMIIEAAVAMLACARIGAVHSVVFGGFSAAALQGRITDAQSTLIITADEGRRGGKKVPLKAQVDMAIQEGGLDVKTVLTIQHTGGPLDTWAPGRDVWYHDLAPKVPDSCPCEIVGAEDPLFILYTSGSTRPPKGVLHTTAGYLLYAAYTHQEVFDYKPGDIYWCTADVGWITGHSYLVYGPLANGATTLMFEGVPTYPAPDRFWQIVDKHHVTQFYTAPTAIRSLLQQGDQYLQTTKRASLRVLGTVGEPINPQAWHWYHDKVGLGKCPIMDTWWQTETGGHMITPLPNGMGLKPGSAALPFYGVRPVLLNEAGIVQGGAASGYLCIAQSWPGQMRTVYNNHQAFEETYFSRFPGYYFTGDGATRDADGYYWITGRVDDVINVSGHRFGTAELERAINAHPSVSESAVVGFPHPVKGEGIYSYIVLKEGAHAMADLAAQIQGYVARLIGPIGKPDKVVLVPGLPKTRSGKIMRRILRKIAADAPGDLGDTSTLADPGIVTHLIEARKKNA